MRPSHHVHLAGIAHMLTIRAGVFTAWLVQAVELQGGGMCGGICSHGGAYGISMEVVS